MTMYDVIFESLQSDLEAGKITEEEAVEVNEAAFEKYGDVEVEESTENEEPITLEDINEYLEYVMSERTHYEKDRFGNDQKLKGNKSRVINAVDKEADKASWDSRHKDYKLARAIDDDSLDTRFSDIYGSYHKKGHASSNDVKSAKDDVKYRLDRAQDASDYDNPAVKRYVKDEYKKNPIAAIQKKVDEKIAKKNYDGKYVWDNAEKMKKNYQDEKKKYQDAKNKFDKVLKKAREQKKDNYGKALSYHEELKKNGLLEPKKESVNETKLNIYEAFESGAIDAKEKVALLGLLAEE